MSSLVDYNRCPRCSSGVSQIGNYDVCTECSWKVSIRDVPDCISDASPGTRYEGEHGVYERTDEGDWLELGTGVVYSDPELACQERNLLNEDS